MVSILDRFLLLYGIKISNPTIHFKNINKTHSIVSRKRRMYYKDVERLELEPEINLSGIKVWEPVIISDDYVSLLSLCLPDIPFFLRVLASS